MPPRILDIYANENSNEWATPQWLFDVVNRIHGPFDLDVAATAENAKCERFYNQNGLDLPWAPSICWCNPPYCGGVENWIEKAANADTRVACLLPAYTDRAWWHNIVMPRGKRIYFVRSKVSFGNKGGCAPFSSVVVVFDSKIKDQKYCSLTRPARR